jgi:hypothetical protein
MEKKDGKLDIGLSYYQEESFLSAIKLYSPSVMDRSLLSIGQKDELIKESIRRKQVSL